MAGGTWEAGRASIWTRGPNMDWAWSGSPRNTSTMASTFETRSTVWGCTRIETGSTTSATGTKVSEFSNTRTTLHMKRSSTPTSMTAVTLRASTPARTITNIYDVLCLNNSKNIIIATTMDIFACLEETGFDKHFSS